jgi:hypothetical protein
MACRQTNQNKFHYVEATPRRQAAQLRGRRNTTSQRFEKLQVDARLGSPLGGFALFSSD